MATEQELSSRATHMQYFTDDDSDDEMVNQEDEDEEEEGDDSSHNENSCKSMFSVCGRGARGTRRGWSLGQVLDPRAKWVQEWNRIFLLVCATGLFVDPLFFYALSISDTCMCLFIDGWFAITVTALRCMTDVLHVWNMWLQLKMAKRTYGVGTTATTSSSTIQRPDSRSVALRYLKAKKGFIFDLFVILPLPQVQIN